MSVCFSSLLLAVLLFCSTFFCSRLQPNFLSHAYPQAFACSCEAPSTHSHYYSGATLLSSVLTFVNPTNSPRPAYISSCHIWQITLFPFLEYPCILCVYPVAQGTSTDTSGKLSHKTAFAQGSGCTWWVTCKNVEAWCVPKQIWCWVRTTKIQQYHSKDHPNKRRTSSCLFSPNQNWLQHATIQHHASSLLSQRAIRVDRTQVMN